MTDVPPFPLLKLPLLPLNEVISYMQPVDQMWLSMVSKRTNNLVKGKQNFNLEIINREYCCNYEILCENQNGSKFLTVDIINIDHQCNTSLCLNIDGLSVPVQMKNDSLTIFWKNGMEVLQKMTTYLCHAFAIQRIYFKFFAKDEERIFKIMELSQELESKFEIKTGKIQVSALSTNNDLYRCILQKCYDVPELSISVSQNQFGPIPFSYRHNLNQPNTANCYCIINFADWYLAKDMNLLLKCNRIKMKTLKWTTNGMTQFLKIWMYISTMEDIDLIVEDVEPRFAVEGLPVVLQNKIVMFNGREIGPVPCYEIQRNDRAKADIWRYERYLVMRSFQ